MTWTARELEMAGAHPRLSYGEIARTYGVTRNQVAGLFYRMRHGIARSGIRPAGKGRPNVWDNPLLDLLADGRPRTRFEMAERLNGNVASIYKALRRLERKGMVARASMGGGNLPDAWKWREDDDDDTAPPLAVYVP